MELVSRPALAEPKMGHIVRTIGKPTAHFLKILTNHRELIATIFPGFESEELRDAPDPVVKDQEELFCCAASQGALSSVLALVEDKRFSCDKPDCFGRTPLHWAADQGHCNVVRALLRAGACVDLHSQRKATPIMLAASRGHTEVVGVLLHYCAGKPDCWPMNRHRRGIDHWRSTALHGAAAGGHMRTVEALLDAGFDRGQHDGAGLTPAEVSARMSHSTSPAITHLLLRTSDMGGKLVYDYADMMMQDVAMVSGLVKGGAFLEWRDRTGETPLHRAVHFHHAATSRVLLRAGADPNLRDRRGTSPLHIAVCTECVEIVADLLEAGADTELLMVTGHSLLHRAISNNRVDIVWLLLNAGASVEHRDAICGHTPLSWACRGCLAPIVRTLVEAGADVESRSSSGLTPLHWACRFNDAESVEALLNAGADPGAVDQVAASYAIEPRSSSQRGTIVLLPVAIDVIGLGYPPDLVEDSIRPYTGGSVTPATRRLDAVSIKRIESALQVATHKRSWRRRGWLVMLENRCVARRLAGLRDMRWPGCLGGCSHLTRVAVQPRCAYVDVEHPLCAQQKRVAPDLVISGTDKDKIGSSHSHRPQKQMSNGQTNVGTRASAVDRVEMAKRATFRQHDQARGDNGAHEGAGTGLFPVVGALLELAAVEVGVFRRVVMFL